MSTFFYFSRHPLLHDDDAMMRLVPPPQTARTVALILVIVFVLFGLSAVLAPWRQNVSGQGRVIAYAPLERRQTIEATVKGRVVEWWVQEGEKVKEGQRIALIQDNDPNYFARLEAERDALERQLLAYTQQRDALSNRIGAAERERDSKVAASTSKVAASRRKLGQARQKLAATEAKLETNLLNLARQRTLAEQGLTSQRKLELARLYEAQSRTERDGARAGVEMQRDMLDAARADLINAQANADGKLDKARAELAKAESSIAAAQGKLTKINASISRQSSQLITAPRDGSVLRLLAAAGGEQVKPGDPLLIFVPDTDDRAVELWVDGNDAALITPGRQVRLQFEGWPAVQFTGWPSVAVGTFGGTVTLVDAADDGNGNFRIVVRPDTNDEPWPAAMFLRQGVRANGWVMLEEVALGFEIWRQLNGFPPTVAPPESYDPTYSKTKDGAKGSKPPKSKASKSKK